MFLGTPPKIEVYATQNVPEGWDISFYPNFYAEFEYLNVFPISAPTSNWGRFKLWLVFCAASDGLKTNHRASKTKFAGPHWACPGMPWITRAPRYGLNKLYEVVWTFPVKNLPFFCPKSPIYIKVAKLAVLAKILQIGSFFSKNTLGTSI